MEMDKYIKERRTTETTTPRISVQEKLSEMKQNMNEWKVFSLFKKKETNYPEYEDEDDDDYVEEESEIEAIDEIEEELEERREGLLRRFFKKLRMRKRRRIEEDDEDYVEYDEPENKDFEEIKEVIKITHKWLEELPPETIERFRRSEDFIRYKETLKRLGMIK
jgi:hypothetical protein